MSKNFVIIIIVALLACSCGKGRKSPTFKVENFSNGKAGEVVLIMGSRQFSDAQKDTVIAFLTQPQPAINQIEPMFNLLKLQPKDFTPHFQRHRNIVQFDMDTCYATSGYSLEKNVWTSPQIVIRIKGNSSDNCMALFAKHQQEILEQLYNNDLLRLQTVYQKETDANIQQILRNKFNIQLSAPSQYFIANQTDDFLWLRYKTARNDRFIMIYKVPATELNREKLIAARNEITKQYIPGTVRGAYPILATWQNMPYAHPIVVGTKSGMEMRGLWESVNDKMGGPFYSFSFLDASGQYCITIDGFVYAPQEEKRDYIREIEAIVKTVK